MLNKIYLVILTVAILIGSFFTYYSYSWLQSIGDPKIAAESFEYFSGLGWSYLWASFLVLLIFSNLLIWKNGLSWSLWTSFVYFALFIILQTIWLTPSFLAFKKENGLAESNFSFTPFVGVFVVILLGAAVFGNQFLMFRLKDKLFGNKPEDGSAEAEE